MNKAFLALVALTLLAGFAQFAHAADNFDYVSFNQRAIKEMEREEQFFAEVAAAPNELTKLYGFLPAVSEEDVEKMDLDIHLSGIRGILTCLKSGNPQTTWAKIAETDSSTLQLTCAGSGLTAAFSACIAGASRLPPLRYTEVEKPNCYNPTFAALLQIYREKSAPTDALLEERVQNNLYFTAAQRERLGQAYLDLGRMKYRYASQKELARYADEHLLSDSDRRGLRVLAECLRQKAPIGLFTAYAERGEFPPESYLRSLKCISPHSGAPLEALQANWAAMGHAIAGHNILLRSPYSGTPSRVYDIIRATDKYLAQEATDAILETDKFANVHVPGLKESVKDRISFKGATLLPLEQRIELSYQLENRFLTENQDRIQNVKTLKTIAAGANSCVLGELEGSATGAVASVALRASSKLPGGWKAAGMVATVGLAVYGVKETVGQTINLIKSYKDIPLDETIGEACGVASSIIDMTPDIVEVLKNTRKSGAKVDLDEQPPTPQVEAPGSAKKTETRTQEETPAQTSANNQVKGSDTPAGRNSDAEAWTRSNPTVFTPKNANDKPPSTASRKKAQKQIQEHDPDVLTKKVVEQEKPVLDELEVKKASKNPEVSAKAETELAVKRAEANSRALDAADSDGSTQLSSHGDEEVVVYVPKDKSSTSLPKRVVDKLKNFYSTAKDKLKTLIAPKTTPDNTVVFTPAQMANKIRKSEHSSERMSLLRQALGSPDVSVNAKKTAVLRKTAIGAYQKTLNPQETRTFIELMGLLYNPKTLEEIPGGLKKARDYYRDKIFVERSKFKTGDDEVNFYKTYPYDETFAQTLLLSVDPQLKRFDVAGEDNALVRSMVKLDKTKDILATSIASSKALRDAAADGKPLLSVEELDHLLEVGADFSPGKTSEDADAFKKFAEPFISELPAAYAKSFDAAAKDQQVAKTLKDATSVTFQKKGEGGFRKGFLQQQVFEGSNDKLDLMVKIGVNDKNEINILARNSKYGLAPEPYEMVARLDKKGDPLPDSIFYQEFIKGKPMGEAYAAASATEKTAILEDSAELDALFGTRGAVVDTDGKILMPFVQDGTVNGNIFLRDKPKAGVENTGRAVYVDLDPKLTSLREPHRWFHFQLLLRSHDFPGADLTRYIRKMHAVFKRELGDAGDAVFKKMMVYEQTHMADPNGDDTQNLDIADFSSFKDARNKANDDVKTTGTFFAVIHSVYAFNDPDVLSNAQKVRSNVLTGVSNYATEIGLPPSKGAADVDFKSALSGQIHCTIAALVANAC